MTPAVADPNASGSGLRLGILIPEFPGQTHAFFWREIQSLRELGDTVSIFSTRCPPDNACPHAFGAEARRETSYLFPPRLALAAVRLLVSPVATLRALAYLAGLRETSIRGRLRLLGLLPVAADLVARAGERRLAHLHVHSAADSAHLAAVARALGGPPYSVTLHGDLPVYGVDHRAKLAGAAFVTTVTRALRRQVCDSVGVSDDAVHVIAMGVDTAKFAPGERGASGSVLRLVSVARLSLAKGHRYALRAMAAAVAEGVEAEYVIAGEGNDRAAVEAEVEAQGLGARVRFAGRVSEEEVLALLHGADALVLSSVGLGEAAPVAVMEAMACGLPVICSVIGGTGDMIDDGVDGHLVAQADVEGLTRAITSLARDPAARSEMGAAARRKALAAFDYRVAARKLHDRVAAAGASEAGGAG